MRNAIRALPDGVYAAQTYLDGFLDRPDPASKELPITVAGDAMTVDLAGTAD